MSGPWCIAYGTAFVVLPLWYGSLLRLAASHEAMAIKFVRGVLRAGSLPLWCVGLGDRGTQPSAQSGPLRVGGLPLWCVGLGGSGT